MNKRINIEKVAPEAFKAMIGLESFLAKSDLNKTHWELIKIRASQLNGFAYCINLHTTEALKAGETPQRIFLLNAWKESELFDEKEQIILEMTEQITFIDQEGLSDNVYEKALELFGEKYVAEIIMAIVTINAWNRIAISTQKMIS